MLVALTGPCTHVSREHSHCTHDALQDEQLLSVLCEWDAHVLCYCAPASPHRRAQEWYKSGTGCKNGGKPICAMGLVAR
jgi:hypothetical protein